MDTCFSCSIARAHTHILLLLHVAAGQNVRKLVKDGFVIRKPAIIHSRSRARAAAEARSKGRHTGFGEFVCVCVCVCVCVFATDQLPGL